MKSHLSTAVKRKVSEMISREKRFVECNTSILWITCQVFSTVSNCRKCVAFFLKDVKMDEDPPRREELLDSQEDITEVQPDKVVNQNVPSEGQDTIKEKKHCDASL